MIRKVCEADAMTCPTCEGTMKVIAFLTAYAVVDRIINHLMLTFVADRPPPAQVAVQEYLLAARPAKPKRKLLALAFRSLSAVDCNHVTCDERRKGPGNCVPAPRSKKSDA